MEEPFEISEWFNASPKEVYEAWLSSAEHSKMTGGEAKCSSEIGGTFTAWDGYIMGENIDLEAGKKIVQKWRTTEFDDHDPDSLLELTLQAENNGTRLILRHSNIPDGHQGYRQGWYDHYFAPMSVYFEK